MKVELLRYTPDGEKLIASAAKLCYSDSSIEEIEEGLTEDKVESFLQMLVDLGHESPIEHISFTFGAEGVSRTLTHQLVRHRIASYSQQSQRYVKLSNFEYVIPPEIEKDEEAKAIFVEAMEKDSLYYNKLVGILYEKHLNRYLADGLSERKAKSKAEKEAIEDARYVFPNACTSKIVYTMNARVLLNFFKLRACNRAQWEIRELAIEMLKLVQDIYPTLFKNAGPGCLRGACPEGAMTCGDIVEVRKRFSGVSK